MALKWFFEILILVAFSNAEGDDYEWKEFYNPDGKYEYDDILENIKKQGRANTNAVYSYLPTSAYGPSKWSSVWPACGGNRQTPINIETSLVKKKSNPSVSMSYYRKPVTAVRVI
jgi:hypothetical protein